MWAISIDVLFVFSMKETILTSLSWFLAFVPVLSLIVFHAFVLLCVMACFVLPLEFASTTGCFLAVLC
jgi:hypothetical protein